MDHSNPDSIATKQALTDLYEVKRKGLIRQEDEGEFEINFFFFFFFF